MRLPANAKGRSFQTLDILGPICGRHFYFICILQLKLNWVNHIRLLNVCKIQCVQRKKGKDFVLLIFEKSINLCVGGQASNKRPINHAIIAFELLIESILTPTGMRLPQLHIAYYLHVKLTTLMCCPGGGFVLPSHWIAKMQNFTNVFNLFCGAENDSMGIGCNEADLFAAAASGKQGHVRGEDNDLKGW